MPWDGHEGCEKSLRLTDIPIKFLCFNILQYKIIEALKSYCTPYLDMSRVAFIKIPLLSITILSSGESTKIQQQL